MKEDARFISEIQISIFGRVMYHYDEAQGLYFIDNGECKLGYTPAEVMQHLSDTVQHISDRRCNNLDDEDEPYSWN